MQPRADSLMEALVNILIGLVVSTIANHLILPATLGVTPTLRQNLVIGLAFTVISLARSYTIRRLFNGRSVWAAISDTWWNFRVGKGNCRCSVCVNWRDL